jgi:lysozyme
MKIGPKGLALIKKWEGYHKKLSNGNCVAYLDKLASKKYWSKGYNGLWTIGYGCTTGVYDGLVWTEKQAEAALLKEVAKHEQAVSEMVKVPLNQNQFDALVSLSYNVGPKGFPTLLRKLNAHDYQGAADSFKLYNKAGGKVYKGLVDRRAEEAELFKWAVPEEVVKADKQLSWFKRFRLWLTGLIPAGFFSWETFAQIKQFATDNAGLICLGVGALAWIVFYVVEKSSVKDYDEDRFVPEGLVGTEKE